MKSCGNQEEEADLPCLLLECGVYPLLVLPLRLSRRLGGGFCNLWWDSVYSGRVCVAPL